MFLSSPLAKCPSCGLDRQRCTTHMFVPTAAWWPVITFKTAKPDTNLVTQLNSSHITVTFFQHNSPSYSQGTNECNIQIEQSNPDPTNREQGVHSFTPIKAVRDRTKKCLHGCLRVRKWTMSPVQSNKMMKVNSSDKQTWSQNGLTWVLTGYRKRSKVFSWICFIVEIVAKFSQIIEACICKQEPKYIPGDQEWWELQAKVVQWWFSVSYVKTLKFTTFYRSRSLLTRHIISTNNSIAHTKDFVVSTKQCIKVRRGRTYCLVKSSIVSQWSASQTNQSEVVSLSKLHHPKYTQDTGQAGNLHNTE